MTERPFLDTVTPLILTYNEAPNIARMLAKLGWAKRIVVIDSGSTDETFEVVRATPNADIVHRPFDDFASQWNFGLAQITTTWVLALDADYVLSDALVRELDSLKEQPGIAGYEVHFVYCIHGRQLRATLYPPRVVLFRRECATHFNEGHTQRLALDGPLQRLAAPIYHDDRKPLARWYSTQQRYAREEAAHLLDSPRKRLRRTERLRRMGWPAPPLVFLYTLLMKRCILDGLPGWLYVFQRTMAETMIAIEIADRRLRRPAQE